MRAREDLLSTGFSATDVRLQAGDTTDAGTPNDLSMTGGTTTQQEGGIKGFFKSLFGMDDNDEHVGMYSEAVRRGGYLVTVDARDDAQLQRAEEIMQRYGAVDLEERSAQWRQEGWTAGGLGTASSAALAAGSTTAAGTTAAGTLGTTGVTGGDAHATIPVVQEELQVGKRAVQRGGVRVFTRVVETPVEETVRLREEHATIERHAVDRPATQADFAALQTGGTIEVRETAEEAVVGKTARVTEEIEVGKQVTEHTETVRDTVRHTDVQVEQLSGEHAMARPGSTDTTRVGTSSTDRPGSRISDAIERAVPGDSDRDGK
jgi:uncharacterized protein (TIGR02271 family)